MPRTDKSIRPTINGRSYWLTLVITWDGSSKNRHYRLIQEEQADLLADFLPRDLHFDLKDGEVIFDERIRTEEGKQIAELIWEEIAAGRMS